VENQTGRKIKVLRSDDGGEYTSTEFRDFYTQEGIRRQLTVPYSPQQNGVAERKNRVIVGAARSMLHDQGLYFSYGLRLAVLQCIYRTRVHIELWGARLLRRPSLGGGQMLDTFAYLCV
jgi:transposase InsO family protein